MQVSLDGGQTWIESENVRVIYEKCGDEEDKNLLVNMNEEGVVLDFMDQDGEVEKTAYMFVDDMEEMTH